jgi:hypothetical protein
MPAAADHDAGGRIGADDDEVIACGQALMGGAGGEDRDIARLDGDGATLEAADGIWPRLSELNRSSQQTGAIRQFVLGSGVIFVQQKVYQPAGHDAHRKGARYREQIE